MWKLEFSSFLNFRYRLWDKGWSLEAKIQIEVGRLPRMNRKIKNEEIQGRGKYSNIGHTNWWAKTKNRKSVGWRMSFQQKMSNGWG